MAKPKKADAILERLLHGPPWPTMPPVPDHSEDTMTLRDYFAGQALAGILAALGSYKGPRGETNAALTAKVVRNSYEIADAMIAERGK